MNGSIDLMIIIV